MATAVCTHTDSESDVAIFSQFLRGDIAGLPWGASSSEDIEDEDDPESVESE